MAEERIEESGATEGRPRLLVVLPEAPEVYPLVSFLGGLGFEVVWKKEGTGAYDILDSEAIDALVCLVRHERIDGLRLLEVALQRNPDIYRGLRQSGAPPPGPGRGAPGGI